ncbi:DUF1761 domain-containing protein [Mariluticola halotolerans]|uniref:DUF1761 domain-containing protein n=1 Tax=Mariluticola halotolerans TaxID=2909283 RepID=UPI0026E1577B|nr:DUF1761 domain-containing protein [Mariluticola halotolerans]UJQ93638.1 DUF1761 domain-containing protein [Mariluticola halotolerans]
MVHFGVNWLGIILAVVASMALGMIWYMGLAKQWLGAQNKTEADMRNVNSVTPFIWAALAQLIIAYFIALLTPKLMPGVDAYNAVLVGVHMWFGFILTSLVLNHRYQGQKWSLTLIDGGYLLGVVIVQGVVIGLFA